MPKNLTRLVVGNISMRLNNKVALISGGGSGIGRACAILFATQGAKVVVADISSESASTTAETINNTSGYAISVEGDVTSNVDVRRIVDKAVSMYGKIDILVNSAGVSSRNAVEEDATAEEKWDRTIEVNLKGTFLVSAQTLPVMEKHGGGSIINLASIIGLVGHSKGFGSAFDPYPSSKGGVVQFTRNMAIHCADNNVRVNCICPGYVRTELTEKLTSDPEKVRLLEDKHPIGRLGNPEDIAYGALYLASDESSFVTGSSLVIDGGYTAQ